MREIEFDIKKLKKVSKDNCFICKKGINCENIIYKDENIIAFLDLYPSTKGYTLVATKKHIEEIAQLSKEEYLHMQNIIFSISKAIKKSFNPKRICILKSGDILKHLHFHIIPIYNAQDNFLDILLRKKSVLELSKEERRCIASDIKKALII
jgi:diadenosine tetraphosphate (Ap4A) HIT family hydrolase